MYLNNEDKILDQHGASALFQTHPAYIKVTEGKENLACLQLKKNSLMRWYTSCCRMPVANTMVSARMPFAGVSVKLMKFSTTEEMQKTLGPVVMKAFGRSARGEGPEDAHDTFPKSFMPRILGFMAKGILLGKHKPSPFFENGKPVVASKVIEQ